MKWTGVCTCIYCKCHSIQPCSVTKMAEVLRQAIEKEEKLLYKLVLSGASFHINEVNCLTTRINELVSILSPAFSKGIHFILSRSVLSFSLRASQPSHPPLHHLLLLPMNQATPVTSPHLNSPLSITICWQLLPVGSYWPPLSWIHCVLSLIEQ